MRFTPYLYFEGDREVALRFYAARGLGSIRELRRYAGTPMADRDGGGWRDKVLHSEFVGPSVHVFASDGADSEPMKGCALPLEFEDVVEVADLFASLSEGGRGAVTFAKQFWGDCYGNFADKFGVQWAIDSRSQPSHFG